MAAEQIHLEADEVSKKVESIWKELQQDNFVSEFLNLTTYVVMT